MQNLKMSRTEIVECAADNPCLYKYNFLYLAIVSLWPIFLVILAFNPPVSSWAFILWALLLVLALPCILAIKVILSPFVIAAAFASFRNGKGAIWLDGNQLHFFDHIISIDEVAYLVRKPKFGLGDFELHMTNGQEISYPDAFVIACY